MFIPVNLLNIGHIFIKCVPKPSRGPRLLRGKPSIQSCVLSALIQSCFLSDLNNHLKHLEAEELVGTKNERDKDSKCLVSPPPSYYGNESLPYHLFWTLGALSRYIKLMLSNINSLRPHQ